MKYFYVFQNVIVTIEKQRKKPHQSDYFNCELNGPLYHRTSFFFSFLKEWVTKSAISDWASDRHFLKNEQGEAVMSRKTPVVFGAHDETWTSMGKLEL